LEGEEYAVIAMSMTIAFNRPWHLMILGILAIFGGGLLALAYSNDPVWWTAWLAPAPALAAVLLTPSNWRRYVGLGVGILAGVLSFDYRVETGSLTAAVVIAAAYSLAWSSTLRLTASAAERWGAIAAMPVLPTAWAAIDTLLIQLSPHGSMGSLAYSQADMLPSLQLASLGGVPAVTFLILLPGSAAGLAIARGLGGPAVRRLPQAAGLAIAVTAAALLYGNVRLGADAPPSGPEVAMITADARAPGRRDWGQFQATYGLALDRVARPGRTVLLPEAILRLDATGLAHANAALKSLARERKTTIVVGVVVDKGRVITNRAVAYLPDGRNFTYFKQHLVPGLERDLAPGNRDLIIASPVVSTGIAICKDMHFPTLGRSYATEGARLMLVPANDFEVDDRLMMTVAAVRGIEGGYAVARAARSGMSAVSDPYGRILAKRRSGQTLGTLISRVPAALAAPPVYARVGDLFGWTCVLGWLGLLIGLKLQSVKAQAIAD
jgi:apolipoprotein N-acyltransferase